MMLPVITIPFLLIGAAACQSHPASTADESAVLAYADPATDMTLQGLSENNLEKYTQYGNEEFKAAIDREVFDNLAAQINGQLGTYESKQFVKIEEQQGYTSVHYKARFSKGEVGVRMVFDKDQQVAGQWFE